MFIYSSEILQFLEEIKQKIKEILRVEVGLRCAGDRFYDRQERYSYPIKVALYNHRPFLGYFDPEFYELGFHERLLHGKKEPLHHVIRHELAHYLVFITYGFTETPHDFRFKEMCQKFGWGEEVSSARMAIDAQEPQEERAILRKVKKLMALSTSRHSHESEQATIKCQQLLLKHNLEFYNSEGPAIYMQRLMQQKKESAKMRAIASILQTFLVSVIYHRGREFIYLEIVGEAVNVKIAEYVASVLDAELESLWKLTQKSDHLRGKVAKNSFFLGVAKGYCDKVQALQKTYSENATKSLIVLEKKLAEAKDLVYPKLSSKTSSTRYCPFSSQLGQKAGKTLAIIPAVSTTPNSSKLLI